MEELIEIECESMAEVVEMVEALTGKVPKPNKIYQRMKQDKKYYGIKFSYESGDALIKLKYNNE